MACVCMGVREFVTQHNHCTPDLFTHLEVSQNKMEENLSKKKAKIIGNDWAASFQDLATPN